MYRLSHTVVKHKNNKARGGDASGVGGFKFHRLKQSRGQQGIGISAAVKYSQMTTGEPANV